MSDMDSTQPAGLPEMKRVGDIMIPLSVFPSVGMDETLRVAIAVIEGAELEVGLRRSLPRALLVFDSSGDVVGVVRRRDLMRGLEPKFLVSQPLEYRKKLFDIAIDPNLTLFSYERVVKGIREQASRPVRDVMLPIEITIAADEPIMKAVYEMVTLSLTLIPVVDNGNVVGVLRSVDLFHELAQLLD